MFAYRHLVLATAAGCLSLASAAPALAATTINFETKADGSATTAGALVGNDYASLGLTFNSALYFQCGGGCPTPNTGHFISGAATNDGFSVLFNGTTDAFSFANVSASSGFASAYDSGGALLQTLTFSSYPGTFSFGVTGIHSVTFGTQGQFGVDNFSFGTLSAAVPEPSTWALMLLGLGAVGISMRRRNRKVVIAA